MATKNNISVIIPCFDTKPEYLQEAVDSVLAYKGETTCEIIITDDGSTDELTLHFLKGFNQKNIKIIYQSNKGPAAARNAGVKESDSDYILFLDSDNKILPEYIDEGIKALCANEKACMAYGNPLFFGNSGQRDIKPLPFDIKSILLKNYIDTCSVVRKKAWEDVGGMDDAKEVIGYEDWEFWINLYKAGWEFIYLNKPMFKYRLRTESLISSVSDEKFKEATAYIYRKHWDLIYKVYHQLYSIRLMYKKDAAKPFRSFFKYLLKKQSI